MNAETRRKLEMGKRALDFSKAHQDPSPGYAAVLTRLETLVTRAEQLAAQQQDGILQVRNATRQKRDLRRGLKEGPLVHLTRVGKMAGKEVPEVSEKLALGKTTSCFTFRTAARRMAADAAANKDLLEKHGLAQTAFDTMNAMLDQLDAAMDQSANARQAHVGASVELDTLGTEISDVVRVMEALNVTRFPKESELIGAWISARNVATPHPAPTPKPADGQPPVPQPEVKSAA